MAAVDLITALGRLLQDGAQRDAFAADATAYARRIGLREEHRAAFLQLIPAELEFQARVLLHKRFDLVRKLLPVTCNRLGLDAWLEFEKFSRATPPRSQNPVVEDAFGFVTHLHRRNFAAVDPIEAGRCDFAFHRRRFAIHVAHRSWLPRLQMLFRRGQNRWSEWQFYFGC